MYNRTYVTRTGDRDMGVVSVTGISTLEGKRATEKKGCSFSIAISCAGSDNGG